MKMSNITYSCSPLFSGWSLVSSSSTFPRDGWKLSTNIKQRIHPALAIEVDLISVKLKKQENFFNDFFFQIQVEDSLVLFLNYSC